MTLDLLPCHRPARVTAVNWSAIEANEAHRLRSLGLEEDVELQVLHRGMLFWKDPLAVRIGRMTIAMRARVASAIAVEQAVA